jgi:hypothetical protein
MKVFLPFALFFAISVDGKLRGDHNPGENMPRSLKHGDGCSSKMGMFVKHWLGICAPDALKNFLSPLLFVSFRKVHGHLANFSRASTNHNAYRYR